MYQPTSGGTGGSVPGLCGVRRLQRLPKSAVRLGKVKELSVEDATWIWDHIKPGGFAHTSKLLCCFAHGEKL